jgi:putative tryptophan/tyrosine transport system substrate-binding protein
MEDTAPDFEVLKARADTSARSAPKPRTNRIRINTLALGAQLRTMHGVREFVEAAGLMSYGPNVPDGAARLATIPAGESPANRGVQSLL